MNRYKVLKSGRCNDSYNEYERLFEYLIALDIWHRLKVGPALKLANARPDQNWIDEKINSLNLPKTCPAFDNAEVLHELNCIIDRFIFWRSTAEYKKRGKEVV